MTKFKNRLDFPHKAARHNSYAIGRTNTALEQCRVVVILRGANVDTRVYNENRELGSNQAALPSGSTLTVTGLPLALRLTSGAGPGISLQDAVRNYHPSQGQSPAKFVYGTTDPADPDFINSFSWHSSQSGTSKQFNQDGLYCTNNTSRRATTIRCYFPCVAAA